MLYLPFARDRWVSSPFLRGGGNTPSLTTMGSAATAATSTTQSVTITQSVAVGEVIFGISYASVAVAGTTFTFSDSGVNTWATDITRLNAGPTQGVAIGHAVCTVALTSGSSTIACAYSNTSTDRLICAFKLSTASGLLTPIVVDGSNSAVITTGTAITTGSVTPTVPFCFGVAAYTSQTGSKTGTPPAGWTERFEFNDGFATLVVNTSTVGFFPDRTAQNPSETLSSTGAANGVIALYRGTQLTMGISEGGSLAGTIGSAVR